MRKTRKVRRLSPQYLYERNVTTFDPTTERQHLFGLCRRWTGEASAAEDLAQETILIGLRRAARPGPPPTEWSSYLAGIARRLCQTWQAQRLRDESRVDSFSGKTEWLPGYQAPDPLEGLIQAEREDLVDRALGALKEPVRQVLVARYIEDLPMTEIAARLGLSENVATVRVHRGREALRKVLETALRTEAASHGLLATKAAQGWRETPLYCCRCGKERLIGRFEPGDFALHCPTCTGQLDGMSSHAAPLDASAVLAGVHGFRAGLNRINRWWQGYIADALEKRTTSCPRCGRLARVHLDPAEEDSGLNIRCDACRATTFYIHPTGLLYHSDEAQTFWRQYPRMQNKPHRQIVCEGRPAILTVFADRITSARIEMVFDAATLHCLRVETIGG